MDSLADFNMLFVGDVPLHRYHHLKRNLHNPFAIKRVMTFKLATLVGRKIPVVGWAVLGADRI